MAPTRYSLHYEDYSEHLMSRFGKLLQVQSLVDMTLMCSSHTLRVHKAVLAASSAYFQEVLQKQTGEPLIILKMRFSVLKSLVEFMYCGKTQCLEENLDELVAAAQFLKIKGLSKVTKEGLGITNSNELPVFTPPVVISQPPQSLIELKSQENPEPKLPTPHTAPVGIQSMEPAMGRTNKEMVVRIPFDIEKGGGGSAYADPPRAVKPRRGRPSARRTGWEGGTLGRAAERALMRREQDSRKAIHHLKHLQTRHIQDYMEQVTLTQAVNSICGPEAGAHNYMNIDNNYVYMDQPASINPSASVTYNKDQINDAASYSAPSTSGENSNIGSAMSEYVNALKNAGLPTDLPILFESGDGSYVNVNEQVLLDMVQSSEIQYEVIDEPNIIENVADPNGIKSIDDLSKSIERGEMLMDVKSYAPPSFDKNAGFRHDEAINSLDSILPDNLESFGDQQSYVVLDSHLPSTSIDNHASDFSCIDGDMQFFTKSMSEDVKKYYESQALDEPRDIDLCPTSTALDTSFTITLLDSKTKHFNTNNPPEMNRNDDCYDFGLQLSQIKDFKEDALDCLISTPKRNDNNMHDEDAANERAKIIKDLMNIENNMNLNRNHDEIDNVTTGKDNANNSIDFSLSLNEVTFENECSKSIINLDKNSEAVSSSGLQWNGIDLNKQDESMRANDVMEIDGECGSGNHGNHKESETLQVINATKELCTPACVSESVEGTDDGTVEVDIPFAVGLLPMKLPAAGDESLKRRSPEGVEMLDNIDAKCLRRKAKHKKL